MKRVLIAEDDPLTADAIAGVASRWGHVKIAASRASAIELFDHEGPDAWIGAIIDVGLPDGSGFDLLTLLRGRRGDLPALIITGQESRSLANRAQAMRAEFAYKPFGSDNLEPFLRAATANDPDTRVALQVDELATGWSLTKREREIVALAVAGHSRDGIMLILGITENTLKSQTRSLLHKARSASLEAVARVVLERAIGLPASAGVRPPR